MNHWGWENQRNVYKGFILVGLIIFLALVGGRCTPQPTLEQAMAHQDSLRAESIYRDEMARLRAQRDFAAEKP